MPDFESRLRDYAEVIVRVGLNLQRGQRLLIAEPYELQGVARSALPLVEAVKAAAIGTGCLDVEIIWGDAGHLRELAVKSNWHELARLAADNADKMHAYVENGDALLFLLGSQPTLMEGLPSRQVAQARNICSEHFGGIAQQLVQGATNWTATPAPSPEWADTAFPELPAGQRLDALWETVFAAVRIQSATESTEDSASGSNLARSIAAWESHLKALAGHRDELNSQRFRSVQFRGPGTDLIVTLPREHLWCTACLRSKAGVDFVANLPTEEVFTLPHKDSAHGTARIARPITFGGAIIDGIEFEFALGRIINATARTGDALLQRLITTDPGACRLGEIALLGSFGRGSEAGGSTPPWASGRLLHHVLLDENASSHIALGEGYGFCLSAPNPDALNRSLIHVDLSLSATANLRK